jgi:ribonucleoside-triphosphate reductase
MCGRKEDASDDEGFERIRRITGYLVGDMSHWNNGKRAEEADRVKHEVIEPAIDLTEGSEGSVLQ